MFPQETLISDCETLFNTKMLSRWKQTLKVAFTFQSMQFVTNLLMMKQANMRSELPKVKSSDMLFSTVFPFDVKALKQAALQIGRSFH